MSDLDAVIIDEKCLDRLLSYRVDSDFARLEDRRDELLQIGISLTRKDRFLYALSSSLVRGKVAVIAIKRGSALAEIPDDHHSQAVLRIIQASMSVWSKALTIPLSWKAFHRGSLVSFQTNARSTGVSDRAYIDANPMGRSDLFIFQIGGPDQGDLTGLLPDYRVFSAALDNLPPPQEQGLGDHHGGSTDFSLGGQVGFEVTQGRTLEEWVDTYLTKDQLAFVNAPLNRSIRLRGAAGTGKTLALVIKFLKTCYDKIEAGEPFRAAFFAHSLATVEMIKNHIYSIDRKDILEDTGGFEIVVSTIHHQANAHLRYDLEGITPISLDGHEGRELQHELLCGIIEQFRGGDWLRFRTATSAMFRELIELPVADSRFRGFVYDLMNEFACVIDAYGTKNPEERRGRYLREKRLAWMMDLSTEDREVVLEIYRSFRRTLREMSTISTDQMTADFLGFLDSFRWDAKRAEDGFDFIFVDELHLFNRQERLTLHLLTQAADDTPLVVMAYDPRQSPRDTFMEVGIQDAGLAPSSWKDTKLGVIEAFEFQDVFRYTPQILSFLDCLDQAFPAEDFGAEWGGDIGRSMLPDGPIPKVQVFPSSLELYNSVFERATRLANQRGSQAKTVAVLCASLDTFKTYLGAGRYRRNFVSVSSREEISAISNAGKRFIYSAPEYVAGLQFDTVFLIDVNSEEIQILGGGVGGTRRFVSTLYLGASRAERELFLAARSDRGGAAELVKTALVAGALTEA